MLNLPQFTFHPDDYFKCHLISASAFSIVVMVRTRNFCGMFYSKNNILLTDSIPNIRHPLSSLTLFVIDIANLTSELMNRALEAAQRANDAKSRFLATISHGTLPLSLIPTCEFPDSIIFDFSFPLLRGAYAANDNDGMDRNLAGTV